MRADHAAVHRAAQVLQAGGLVVFPTDTVYGIAVDPLNAGAVQRLYEIKGRAAAKPLQVLLADPAQLSDVARDIAPAAQRVANRFFPGGITLVLKKAESIPSAVVAGGDTVGVRVPDHAVSRDLVRAFGRPLAATSANRSGQPSPQTAQEALVQLGDDIDFVLDGGPCPVGLESTVIDLSGGRQLVLRKGAVSVEDLEAVLGTRMLA